MTAVQTNPGLVAALRSEIDRIDQAIAELLNERASISGQIQHGRVQTGAPRVDLTRERQVIAAYQARLGEHGSDLANAVLTLCRGDLHAGPA